MKHGILLILSLLLAGAAFAGDTLTRAQVYNFGIGDTFDYKIESHSSNGPYNGYYIAYSRYVIASRHYSAANDTLFIVRRRELPAPAVFDTLVITRLDSFQVLETSDGCNGVAASEIVTDSMYYGRIVNTASYVSTDCSRIINYAEGLGKVKVSWHTGIPGGEVGYITGIEELIYFSKNDTGYGTPYYELNGQNLLSYTPIPEECATWIRTAQTDSMAFDITFFQEKISTGSRIWHDGHTLVEMIYNFYNYNGVVTPDSLIGYFRNDTLNRKAYLYDKNKVPFYTYDFTKTVGDSVIAIDTILVGNEQRTHWKRSCTNPGFNGYIEGVGGTNGLCPVRTQYFKPHQSYPFDIPVCGALTCFSVCGQTLYPKDSMTNCMLAVGIKETDELDKVSVYPTANSGSFYVSSIADALSFYLYDVVGRCVMQEEINKPIYTLHLDNRTDGMFIYVLRNTAGQMRTGKLIIRQ